SFTCVSVGGVALKALTVTNTKLANAIRPTVMALRARCRPAFRRPRETIDQFSLGVLRCGRRRDAVAERPAMRSSVPPPMKAAWAGIALIRPAASNAIAINKETMAIQGANERFGLSEESEVHAPARRPAAAVRPICLPAHQTANRTTNRLKSRPMIN